MEIASTPRPGTAGASRVSFLLSIQRTHGNRAAARAAGSLRRGIGGRLFRSFGTLEKDLTGAVPSPGVKVIIPPDLTKLDELWTKGMPGITPLEFVKRAIQELPAPPHQRLYLKFDVTGNGTTVAFDLKFQEITESATRPPLPPGEPHTRAWAQIGPARWARNVAGATRQITFGDNQLKVRDERTDAPVGLKGGSGFSRQLFKNLLAMYTGVTPRTVMDITADEEGRYAWARYGFLPSDAEWRDNIRNPILEKVKAAEGADLVDKLVNYAQQNGKPISRTAAEAIDAALQRDDARALFDLVDVASAKEFLWWLFTSGIVQVWHGTLDLEDPVQGSRVRKYVGLPSTK